MTYSPKSFSATGSPGFSLVLVLIFLVLISVSVLAIFVQSVTWRRIAGTAVADSGIDALADTAVELLSGELLAEIQANSNWVDVGGNINGAGRIVAFLPETRSAVLPSRIAPPGSDEAVWKVPSASAPLYPGGPVFTSPVLTSTANSAGRHWSHQRWFSSPGSPRLGQSGGGSVPAWSVLSRSGVEPRSIGEYRDSTGTGYALGRFAFVVYNVGGALALNTVGASEATTWGSQAPFHSAGAPATTFDVSVEGLAEGPATISEEQGDALASWRYSSSKDDFPSARSYWEAFGSSHTKGLVRMGDNAFLSRGDMLRYFEKEGIDPRLAQLFVHENLVSSKPRWSPSADASSHPGGSSDVAFAYRAQSGAAGSINRNLSSVRAPVDFTRLDGRAAKAGEALIASRFPLSRLGWIGMDGPTSQATSDLARLNALRTMRGAPPISTEADLIRAAFGLVWSAPNQRWNYVGSTGAGTSPVATISRINEVSGREPNFFELMKTVVLRGSLGNVPDLVPLADNGSLPSPWYLFVCSEIFLNHTAYGNADAHILQLGANMIDQADEDSFPTRLAMRNPASTPHYGAPSTEWEIVGSENTPLVYHKTLTVLRTEGASPPDKTFFRTWLEFSLFNPYQGPWQNGPTRYRIRQTQGFAQARFQAINPNGSNQGEGTQFFTNPASSSNVHDPDAITIEVPGNETFMNALRDFPRLTGQLPSLGASVSVSNPFMDYTHTDSGERIIGIFTGAADHSLLPALDPARSPASYYSSVFTVFPPAPDTNKLWFVLEADYGGGQWRTIQHLRGYRQSTQNARVTPDGDAFLQPQRTITHLQPDPRTERFGNVELRNKFDSFWNKTLYWQGTIGDVSRFPRSNENVLIEPAGTSIRRGTEVGAARLADNRSSPGSVAAPAARNRDGVQRFGDGWFGSGTAVMPHGDDVSQRPIILNRPFRNIAELGLVFRDEPWKSVNVSTPQSPDLGLLEIFQIEEEMPSQDEALRAGTLDLNSLSAQVAAKLFSRTSTDPLDAGGARLPMATISSLASELSGHIRDAAGQPTDNLFYNASDFGGFLESSPVQAIATLSRVKAEREAAVRALAENTRTTTWNLLVDLAVQSGRYAPGASSLADFMIEAERRYWLHLTIDRTTGEVLQRKLEPVPH